MTFRTLVGALGMMVIAVLAPAAQAEALLLTVEDFTVVVGASADVTATVRVGSRRSRSAVARRLQRHAGAGPDRRRDAVLRDVAAQSGIRRLVYRRAVHGDRDSRHARRHDGRKRHVLRERRRDTDRGHHRRLHRHRRARTRHPVRCSDRGCSARASCCAGAALVPQGSASFRLTFCLPRPRANFPRGGRLSSLDSRERGRPTSRRSRGHFRSSRNSWANRPICCRARSTC